jgi:hypothetical protein
VTTYVDACRDPNLFGPWFSAPSWATWRVVDKALFGLPLTADELAIFSELTGRAVAPTAPAKEAWLIVGRRGGKDIKAASWAVYLATIGAELAGTRARLARGERGVVQILAMDRDQAHVAFRYARAFFEQPLLGQLLKRETADTLELHNDIAIEITTSDRRRVRGRTVIAAIFDEVSQWRTEETSNPDTEIYWAVRPAMATIPNSMLIGISSPHGRACLLWDKHQRHYGEAGDVLVVQAPTWRMNPLLSKDTGEIAAAYLENPSSADAEYGGQFRTDVEQFVSLEVLRACTDPEYERPPEKGLAYVAFVDVSGGSSDSYTIAIGHMEPGGIVVIDCVRETRAPFSPQAVTEAYADLVKAYGLNTVYGDRYGGEWPAEAFALHGINYQASELSKSEIYQAFLPMLNSQVVAMITNDRLERQLLSLERKTARGGREIIDHVRGQHDDLANCVAGAAVHARHVPAAVSVPGFNRPIEYVNMGVA